MSVISDYISQVKSSFEKLPYVLSQELIIDNRGIAYSYHYQGANKRLIFRYDNAEHHPELENFPHHKHIGDKVFSAEEVSLNEVLGLIIDQQK